MKQFYLFALGIGGLWILWPMSHDSPKSAESAPTPTAGRMLGTIRGYPSISDCQYLMGAPDLDATDARVHELIDRGDSTMFDEGERVTVVDEGDPNDLWILVGDEHGAVGCISRLYFKADR